jgi:hypothetical protein
MVSHIISAEKRNANGRRALPAISLKLLNRIQKWQGITPGVHFAGVKNSQSSVGGTRGRNSSDVFRIKTIENCSDFVWARREGLLKPLGSQGSIGNDEIRAGYDFSFPERFPRESKSLVFWGNSPGDPGISKVCDPRKFEATLKVIP